MLDRLHLEDVGILSVITAGLANLVSNVPAVLVLKPFVARLADSQQAWLVVAMASTFAGNFHARRIGRQSDRRTAGTGARGYDLGNISKWGRR